MNDILGGPAGVGSLIERAKAIILKPADTWPVIAAEQTSSGEIFTRYAVPLAAIGPVASFIGGQVFGISAFIATYRPSLMTGLTMAVTSFIMGLISLVVVALIADFLAPKFDGQSNRTNAFKLVAYSMTPAWVAGILGIFPALAVLGIIAGLYSIYLLYLGAAPLMKVPQDKGVAYTAVTIVCAIIARFVATTVAASVTGLLGGGIAASTIAANGGDSVELNIPGVGKIDTGKIEQAAKQIEAGSQAKPIAGSALQGLLPASLGAYQRTAVESAGVGAVGSNAEGTYTAGDKTIHLTVTDMAALGGIAGMAGAMGVEQNREDANGYERTTTVNGQIRVEKWNPSEGRGKFGTMVGGRFMIEASGEAGSIDELKAAVNAIDAGQLAALAK
ncbi:MAG: Yip1 family protein [Novosphingobium sp.]|uniref:Yip1 family protein n=1 Tax=Novosphingobium sp. TaxID=1874826 RepID=UPI0032B7B23D